MCKPNLKNIFCSFFLVHKSNSRILFVKKNKSNFPENTIFSILPQFVFLRNFLGYLNKVWNIY